MAATWAAVVAVLVLSLQFGPSLMPPAVPAMVQMATNGGVKVPLHRGAGASDRAAATSDSRVQESARAVGSARGSDEHALDTAAVDSRNVIAHPGLPQ